MKCTYKSVACAAGNLLAAAGLASADYRNGVAVHANVVIDVSVNAQKAKKGGDSRFLRLHRH